MDDLIDTLRVVNPRVYESVMRKYAIYEKWPGVIPAIFEENKKIERFQKIFGNVQLFGRSVGT